MIYLDHAATTPVHPEVLEAMLPYFRDHFGNASSVHRFGQDARRAVDRAREQVAALIAADPDEIIFTSGGTEADNLAVFGLTEARADGRRGVVTSSFEHHAVLHACAALGERGAGVQEVSPDALGKISPDAVSNAIGSDTGLVTVMLANNELGTVQDICAIADAAHQRGALFHTDAVQATGLVPVDVHALRVDALTLTGHKMYGPKGTGALYLRRGTRISPQAVGGGHERGRRAGTLNTPGIVGLGKAAEIALREMNQRAAHIADLRDRLWAIVQTIPGAYRNGDQTNVLPGHLNVRFDGVDGEALVLSLDLAGVAASMGSACTSGSLSVSHVLLAIGLPPQEARGALRLTVGRENTLQEISDAGSIIADCIGKLRVRGARIAAAHAEGR